MAKENNLKTAIEQLTAALEKMAAAEFVALDEKSAPPEAAEAYRAYNKLSRMLKEALDFSNELSNSIVTDNPPPRSNYLAMGLKNIHAQLRHILWQARQIAEGDYNQSIDFMGDFGKTFNWAIENLKKRRDDLMANREMLLNIFNSMHSLIVLIDSATGKIVFNNAAAASICKGIDDIANEKRDGLLARIFALSKEPVNTEEDITYLDTRTNIWFKIFTADTLWGENKTVRLFNCVDITKEQAEYESVKDAAFDELTELYVRSQGLPKIEEMYKRLSPACLMCVAFFDLDGLKRTNDTLGHAAGDDLIKRFSDALKRTFRSNDILVRMGGDEFAAAFIVREAKTADDIFTRLDGNVVRSNMDNPVEVEYSRGIYLAKAGEDITVAQMMERADAAMYEDKKARKAAKGLDVNDRS